MKVTWKHLAFLPSQEALAELLQAWSWFLPENFEPVTASTLGDVFFQQKDDAVYWLNTGTAQITRIADSRSAFMEMLKTERAGEWFLPDLIQQLMDAGKHLKQDYCYTYVVLPIFKEGKYEVSNLNPVPAKEHFGVTGTLHKKIKDLPDGAKVRASWVAVPANNNAFQWTDAWLLLSLLYSGVPADSARIREVGDGINHAIFTSDKLEGGLRRLISAGHVVEVENKYSPSPSVIAWYQKISPKRSKIDKDLERVEDYLGLRP